jgi:hypothetical protein
VGVGVGLLVLGLEAPAFALTPTVASFSPTSGPVGCVVVITGTNFDNPDVTNVLFSPTDATGTPTIDATDFAEISATEIWAVVPVGAADGPIAVKNASGTGISPTSFDVTTTGGGCVPTVTSFTPTCGSAGDVVTITGTNLLKSANPGTGATNTAVRFAPYTGATTLAGHTSPNADSPTSLAVIVPSGAADGPIRVSTFNDVIGEGAVLSDTRFEVPPPDCVAGGPTHGRAITLSLKKHLVAKGMVSLTDAADTTTECIAGVPVKIQKRKSGHWKTVGSTTTKDNGAYKKRIKDKPGKYRAKAPKVTLTAGDVCNGAKSRTVKHK